MDLPESPQEESLDLTSQADMDARIIGDGALWDEFVDASPCSTLFHKWDFLRIVEKHTGYKLYPYGIFAGDRLRCVFPLFLRREFGIGAAYSAPPASNMPYLGFITDLPGDNMGRAENEPLMYGIADKVIECVSMHPANYISIQTVPEVQDTRPFQRNGYRPMVCFDYCYDLSLPIDEIWEGFSRSTRRDIRQQEKMGPEIRQSNDVRQFFELMRNRFDSIRLHTYYHRSHTAYVQEAVNAFPDHIKMLYLYRGGNVEGAAINYAYNGRYFLWMGCASGMFNEYFIWQMFKDAKDCGAKQVKNPGADSKRLTPFKSKFNPSLETVYFLYKMDALGELAQNSISVMKHLRSVREAIRA